MKLGMIGLGRMGANMAARLLGAGHEVVAFDRHPEKVAGCSSRRARSAPARSRSWCAKLEPPRAIWLMVPAAGGRRHDRRARAAARRATTSSSTAATPTIATTSAAPRRWLPDGIHYVDVGTSGGVWGKERGYCQMIGGDADVVKRLDPIFAALAPPVDAAPRTIGRERAAARTAEHGYLHCGPQRRRPLRQDGAQRHRVRAHGRLRRGAQHSPPRQRRQRAARRRRRDRAAARPRALPVRLRTSPRSPRSGGAAASSPRGCST